MLSVQNTISKLVIASRIMAAKKLGTKTMLIITFFPVIIIATITIGIHKMDPMYATDKIKEATIIRQVSSLGKSGAKIDVTVEDREGNVYVFSISDPLGKGIGDKVTLRLYERKITGLKIYKLQKNNRKSMTHNLNYFT